MKGTHSARFHALILPFFLLLSITYCAVVMRQGWIQNDEGVLGQTAERMLRGEVPHRDFDEPYSGALTGLNALSFRLWGVRLTSMRIPLLGFYVFYLWALYALARRWLTPVYAGLFGLACVGWGLPTYFAAMPSWYLMFFLGYQTLLLMKYAESGQKRWLFLAGIMGGTSLCFKILGVYLLMAGMVFLMYHETLVSERQAQTVHAGQRPTMIFLVKALIALTVIGSVTVILWKKLGFTEFFHFLLPCTLLTILPLIIDVRGRLSDSPERLKRLVSWELIFLGAASLPLLIFVFIFWREHALHLLFVDLFVRPMQRYEFAFEALPPAWTILTVIPLAVLFWRSALQRRDPPPWLQVMALGAIAILALGGFEPGIYHAVWFTLRPLVPLIAIVGTFWLMSRQSASHFSSIQRQRLFLVLVAMSFMSIVQFPCSFGIYFFYIASFVALARVAVFKSTAQRLRDMGAAILIAYSVFGFLWLARANPSMAGVAYIPQQISKVLLPERAGLQVGKADYWIYETLAHEVQNHSGDSDFIYAGPDCPEVYFLSGKRNPTRYFYEFFSPEEATTEAIMKTIEDRHIQTVVLNGNPLFSPRVSQDLYQAIDRRFPHHEDINVYRLFW